jgi:glutathionylspermidine amidase/synthetase
MKDKPAYWNGIYTGIQFQCVELARRFLLANHGLLFDEVDNAYEIMGLDSIQSSAGHDVFWPSHPNKACHLPPPGSLIVWAPTGHYKRTGHVAVVVQSSPSSVDIIEQNDGKGYRRLHVRSGKLHCTRPGSEILGWKMFPF